MRGGDFRPGARRGREAAVYMQRAVQRTRRWAKNNWQAALETALLNHLT